MSQFGGPPVPIKELIFGLFPLKLSTVPKHSLQSGPPCLSPESLESYLEHPLQRLHVAAFALHDGAQDVPPHHLPGPETQSVPAPTVVQSQHLPGAQPQVTEQSLCPGELMAEGQKGPVPPRAKPPRSQCDTVGEGRHFPGSPSFWGKPRTPAAALSWAEGGAGHLAAPGVGLAQGFSALFELQSLLSNTFV